MQAVERFATSAAPDTVWSVLADVEHWRDWTPTVVEIKPINETRLTVGARYRVVQAKLRPAVYQVTEYVPNQRFRWVQKIPGGTMIADHRLAPRNGGTEVELSFRSEGLLANIVGSIFSKAIGEYVAIEAKSLKVHCDNLAEAASKT